MKPLRHWSFGKVLLASFAWLGFIVLALAYLHVLNFWMVPVMGLTQGALQLILSPLSFLLS